jgi:hypothetical protein
MMTNNKLTVGCHSHVVIYRLQSFKMIEVIKTNTLTIGSGGFETIMVGPASTLESFDCRAAIREMCGPLAKGSAKCRSIMGGMSRLFSEARRADCDSAVWR